MNSSNDVATDVPLWLRGVWRRAWIRFADGAFDDTESVHWMQCARAMADVRVPARGALFDGVIAEQLGGPVAVAVSLIGFGALLWWADRRTGERTAEQLTTRDAWLIGAAQVLALNPGTSRSGITISAMRALGYGRAAAVRMSFVIGVPIIAGAGVWKVVGLIVDGVPDGLASAMLIGVSAAAVTGWLAITALQRLAVRSNFNVFVWYRVALGVAVLGIVVSGIR